MKEVIAVGKTLEDIKEEWSAKWNCLPDQLLIEVIDKPGILNRLWKAKVVLPEQEEDLIIPEDTALSWDGTKYLIYPGREVNKIVPCPSVGKLVYREQEMKHTFEIEKGCMLEFYPLMIEGEFSWEINILPQGVKAVAKVKRKKGGRYVLKEEIPKSTELILENYAVWEPQPDSEEFLGESKLMTELTAKGIVHGIKPNIWAEFLQTDGEREIVIAEYTPPVPPVHADIIDLVENVQIENENDKKNIDFFASKIRICQKDEVLARKIPGKEGIPGKDIFGKTLPVLKMKDLILRSDKNTYISPDGLEILAASPGLPIKKGSNVYAVENVYVLNKDINLETGSIDFPGDVQVGGNVTDGFRVYADGNVRIRGSVTSAEIKAGTGLQVDNNIIASKIIIGEKHVQRSKFCQVVQEVKDDLTLCLAQVRQLQKIAENNKIGQILKVVLEKNFVPMVGKSEELEQMLNSLDSEFVNKDLVSAIRTLKHYLVGLGPLQLEDLLPLTNALQILEHFWETKGNLPSMNAGCTTNYIQKSEVICAGDFVCQKGIYNSRINIEGNSKILGVFRGGEISCSGDLHIWELGGASISATIVKISKNSRFTAEYCHANVRIYAGKEIVRIDEPVQKLSIYREKGTLQVDKFKWDGELKQRKAD